MQELMCDTTPLEVPLRGLDSPMSTLRVHFSKASTSMLYLPVRGSILAGHYNDRGLYGSGGSGAPFGPICDLKRPLHRKGPRMSISVSLFHSFYICPKGDI